VIDLNLIDAIRATLSASQDCVLEKQVGMKFKALRTANPFDCGTVESRYYRTGRINSRSYD